MLSGEGNAGEWWKNDNRSIMSKKATLHVHHTFFVHFFAIVLHDYNVKLPETFLWRKCRMCSRSLFFTAAHFLLALVAASIVTAATKFSCCSSNKKMSPLLFICRSRSLSPFFSSSFTGLPLFLFFSVLLLLHIPNLWTWQLIEA